MSMGLIWLSEQAISIYLSIVKETKRVLLEVGTELVNCIYINSVP
jgi:hypothetical protein